MSPRTLMSLSAAVLGVIGLALLFAPAELQRLGTGAAGGPVPSTLLQLWSAALLGLAVIDWIGRTMALGGIYGRALVVGNLMHWTVGSLVAVRALLDDPARATLWGATAVYGAFALGFAWLLRRHPVREARSAV